MKPLRIFFIILVFGIGPVVTIHAEEVNIKAGEPGSLMNFGMAVATSGNTLIVGATSNQGSSGSIYIFEHGKNSWEQQARINTKDAAVKDWFGWAVAIDGNTAVVGAYEDGGQGQDRGGGIAEGPGFVYVFVRGAKEWTEQARLSAKDKAPVDRFGNSVSISGDLILVGAPFDDDAGENSGSTYLFERQGETWREKAKLTASDAAEGDQFGWDVGIDGDTAVIGAPLDDDAGSKSGAAYIFSFGMLMEPGRSRQNSPLATWREVTVLELPSISAGYPMLTPSSAYRLTMMGAANPARPMFLFATGTPGQSRTNWLPPMRRPVITSAFPSRLMLTGPSSVQIWMMATDSTMLVGPMPSCGLAQSGLSRKRSLQKTWGKMKSRALQRDTVKGPIILDMRSISVGTLRSSARVTTILIIYQM